MGVVHVGRVSEWVAVVRQCEVGEGVSECCANDDDSSMHTRMYLYIVCTY